MQTRAMSEVVSNILLILITIAAVGLIASFIIPFIKDKLNNGTQCFDLKDYIQLEDLGKNCYNTENTSFSLSRGLEEQDISKIIVSLFSEGEGKKFEIINGKFAGVKMIKNGVYQENLEIPLAGEAKTYQLAMAGNKITVSLESRGKTCEIVSSNLAKC